MTKQINIFAYFIYIHVHRGKFNYNPLETFLFNYYLFATSQFLKWFFNSLLVEIIYYTIKITNKATS